MAFTSRMQVVKTYGRHKKRTIKAWISPEADTKARHIFSSPENLSFDTDIHASAQTSSSDDKSRSLHSDEEWFPGTRHQAKKALKEKNVVLKISRSDKKSAAQIKQAPARHLTREKENRVGQTADEAVRNLPPIARGKRVINKLSRKGKARRDGKGSGLDEEDDKTEIPPGRLGVIHSPIDRSSQSSSKRGRAESSDVAFDISCDLFAYSADESDAGSCSRAKARLPGANKMPSLDDSVFASPMVFPALGQNAQGFVETSTPNHSTDYPVEPHKSLAPDRLELDQLTKRVTRSSHRDEPKGAVPELPVQTDGSVDISIGQVITGDSHRTKCEHVPSEARRIQTPDVFEITSDISQLDLNSVTDRITIRKRTETNKSRCDEVISPCSVVVVPLSSDCLSRHSSSSVLSSQIGHIDEADEGENQDEDIQEIKSGNVVIPNGPRLFDCSLHSFKEALTPVKSKSTGQLISARQKVLQQCHQAAPVPFTEAIPPDMMERCVKIGEGVYGEVFRTVNSKDETVALKVIPIEGNFKVNEESQKSFEEILPEIVISRELSGLKDGSTSTTAGFVTVNRVSCCQGSYPGRLLDQWDEYDTGKGSENDRPDVFPPDQLFVVFEFSDGGMDLERIKLNNLHQAVSIFQQVAISLAVAEQSFEFEHRDLHWGNVLVLPTPKKTLSFWLDGEEIKVTSHGVQAGMIDFTLSRLSKDGCIVYCDLSNDETLFTGRGDPQFGIYRKMRDENGNDWEPWNPYTNVLWLHYLLDKLLNGKTYPRAKQDQAQASLRRELRTLSRHLLGHSTAIDVITESGLLEL